MLHRKIAQSQAEPLRVLLCTCEKTRRALLRAARPRRAAAEPCRQAIGSHSSPASALAPATGRAAREGLPTRAKTTFTKDAGGRQRAAHTDAVPGYPRELRGLDQNRDIDDALLRGGLRLAETEFRQTQGRRFTGWEFGATGHRGGPSAGLPREEKGQCGHESRRPGPNSLPCCGRPRFRMGHAGRIGSWRVRQSVRSELGWYF